MQAFLKLDTFRGSSAFYTWLYRIAFNLAMSHARRERKTVSLDGMKAGCGSEPVDGQPAAGSRLLAGPSTSEMVHAALAELTPSIDRSWCCERSMVADMKRSPRFWSCRWEPFEADCFVPDCSSATNLRR